MAGILDQLMGYVPSYNTVLDTVQKAHDAIVPEPTPGYILQTAMGLFPAARGMPMRTIPMERNVIQRGLSGRPNLTESFAAERLKGFDRTQYDMERVKANDAQQLRQTLSRMSPEERAAYEARQAQIQSEGERIKQSFNELKALYPDE